SVFVKGHVPHVVQPVFDPPMASVVCQQPLGPRLLRRQVADPVHHFLFALSRLLVGSLPLDAEDLRQSRELRPPRKHRAADQLPPACRSPPPARSDHARSLPPPPASPSPVSSPPSLGAARSSLAGWDGSPSPS